MFFCKLRNGAMTCAQATKLVSETYVGIKAAIIKVSQDYFYKYIAIFNLLDPINKAK